MDARSSIPPSPSLSSPQQHSSSSSSSSGPFHNFPQKYPRAARRASEFVSLVHTLTKKGPRTLLATVVDTSFLHSMGYALCTTQLGVVRVYGVPYGTVVPQMRLYVRQSGPHSTNRTFVFDGYAPNLSAMGFTSGSLLYSAPVVDSGPTLGITTAIPTITGIAGAVGYYWHFYFYIPSLPSTRVTLFRVQTPQVSPTNTLSFEYLPNGFLQVRSLEDGNGYITTSPVAPHSMHWVMMQPGLGGSPAQDLLIDGQSSFQTTGSGVPSFSGNGANYYGYTLCNPDGSGLPPLGTWISKIGFGTQPGTTPLAVGSTPPTKDSQVPNFNISTSQKALVLYLFSGTPGSGTITNNAAGGGSSNLVLNTAYATFQGPGPY